METELVVVVVYHEEEGRPGELVEGDEEGEGGEFGLR